MLFRAVYWQFLELKKQGDACFTMKTNEKRFFFFIFLTASFVAALFFVHPAYAVSCSDSCSDESSCQAVIAECTKQITTLQGQANTLKNQIAQFDTQIKLTTLKITETQNKIDQLGGRIDQLKVSVDNLTTAFNARAVETYKLSRFENSFIFLLTATDLTDATTRFHYLQKIQEEDQNLLQKLQEAKTNYENEKVDQEALQKELQAQKANLNAQKTAKNNLLTVTKNDEAKYQSLLSQAKAQLASFKGFTSSRGGASLLSGQTKCNDGWSGCYYNQRDSEWGNMSLGGTSYLMKDSGCFVTSVAMMASHVGKDIKPGAIASLPAVFTNQGNLKWEAFSVNGVTISISYDSKGNLDSILSGGNPVIAKLSYSYGDHFIVILRKEGDTYYMNDPYLENGYNKPLSAGGYSIDDIYSLRRVSFN